jgi:hypothetical protein
MEEYKRSSTVTTNMVDKGLTYGPANIGRILRAVKAFRVLIYQCAEHYYALGNVVILWRMILVDRWLPIA